MLIGLLFLNPLLGAGIGAGAGALSGKFADIGINDQFMKVPKLFRPPRARARTPFTVVFYVLKSFC
jgi:uncharacterized membrane protein